MVKPYMMTATGEIRQQIAQVMTARTGKNISADKVNFVKGEELMNIFSAQSGDVTILCWNRGGEFIIKMVSW